MIENDIIEVLRRKFTHLASELDERGRRRWAASEALELGHGGIKAVAQATGLGERTVRRGCHELRHPPAPESPASRRIRRAGQPVISVDAKKKERVGPFANGGRDYQPKGQPERVKTHDFPDKQLGKICPYGVYDPTHNHGWVSVGIDHDTAQFAVESIRRWWAHMGKVAYPQAHALLITADGGGSNASRNRLWKVELQQLADAIGVAIYVRHFPPGTSKWNKIEHRMFCHITENWRGRPLISHEVVVNLIGHTTTNTGLTIQAELDKNTYPTGIKVSQEDMKRLNLLPAKFHGKDWNYAIKPHPQRR